MTNAIEQAEAIAADAWDGTHILLEVTMDERPANRREKAMGTIEVLLLLGILVAIVWLAVYGFVDLLKWVLTGT